LRAFIVPYPACSLKKAKRIMEQTIAYLDCSGGINETLLLGALLDLGFPLTLLEQALASIQLLRDYQLQLAVCYEHGVRGSCFSVLHTIAQTTDLTIADIQQLLASSSLSPHLQQKMLVVCNRLVSVRTELGGEADAESGHGIVGSADALIALIGIVLGLDFLGITHIYVSSLPLTQGFIQTNQGLLPGALPITLEILRRAGAIWRPSLSEVELVNPLSAAILATLACFESPSPLLQIEKVGYGFGDLSAHTEKSYSYGLRLYVGLRHVEQEVSFVPHQWPDVAIAINQGAETDSIIVVESHIDNMSGELLGGFMERLFSAGALDVSYTPIQMKKNRPATLLTILCAPEIGEQLALLVLQETTTLGVRMQQVRRLKAQRHQVTISTSLGPIKVKVKQLGSRIISAAPEYEECQRIARERDIPLMAVYEVAQEAIQSTILANKGTGS
jgi:pyridinium-3,5-bisthiocarboxylic acid mononucleotide nickel chelatase